MLPSHFSSLVEAFSDAVHLTGSSTGEEHLDEGRDSQGCVGNLSVGTFNTLELLLHFRFVSKQLLGPEGR